MFSISRPWQDFHRIAFFLASAPLAIISQAGCGNNDPSQEGYGELASTSNESPDGTSAPDIKNSDGSVVPLDYRKPITCAPGLDAYSFGMRDPVRNKALPLRLDLCISQSNEPTLMRAVIKQRGPFGIGGSPEYITVYGRDKSLKTTGRDVSRSSREMAFAIAPDLFVHQHLDEALAGEYENFALDVTAPDPKYSLTMRGTTDGGRGSVTARDNNVRQPFDNGNSFRALQGVLELSDPFLDAKSCAPGWSPTRESYRVGTASIDFESCYQFDGKTDQIERIGLKLHDDNPALEGKTIDETYDRAKIASVVETTVVHHNFNDSVKVRLPSVTYKLSFVDRDYISSLAANHPTEVGYEVTYANKPPATGRTMSKPIQ
jgi:hypothetical protein